MRRIDFYRNQNYKTLIKYLSNQISNQYLPIICRQNIYKDIKLEDFK